MRRNSYPLAAPRLKDTVLDAHTREPITFITQRYLDVLRFCRWPKLVRYKKSALFGSEIVGTETNQGFTVGIATQVPSGRVWETQPVRHHVEHPGDTVSRIVLYAGRNP